MFSSRLPAELAPNALSEMLAGFRRSGQTLFDLTETNPTVVGLQYPDGLVQSLGDPQAATYRPEPLGLETAREAVAASYREHGAGVDAARIVLTSSTSEAYAFVFKLLCDPGDSVLVPQPSYPLFDLLARLDNVTTAPYRLHPLDAWAIDRDGVTRALTPASRAVLVVSPNNPTGSLTRSSDREWLVELARSRDLAIVSDEVFADYRLSPRPDATTFLEENRVLTFTLGGLSKLAGLPQMKLAWMVVSGPDGIVKGALDRLEIIADTYLSVSTPVQVAAARLFAAGKDIRRAVTSRLKQNLGCLRATVRTRPACTLFEPEGGWSAVLRIPATVPEEQVVLRLLHEAHVLVHPGYFFDFPEGAFLVLSLLPKPEVFEEGVSRLLEVVMREERP